MKNAKLVRTVSERQFAILHILCSIALTLSLMVIFKLAGATFAPLKSSMGAILATGIYTIVMLGFRYVEGTVKCYIFQLVLATIIGYAAEDSRVFGHVFDYRTIILASFVIMMAHNLCVDKILHKIGKMETSRMINRSIACTMFSIISAGSYFYFVKSDSKREIEKAIAITVDLPKKKSEKKRVTNIQEFFMGIYQNAREFESVVKPDEICGYPREWIEQLKSFENNPLHRGEVTESKVHKDRLRPDVMEVGYGTTPSEIEDAKNYGILPKDAEFPTSMTKEEADIWMETVTIPTYDAMVRDKVKVELTLEQRFALLSFCHNTGIGNLEKLACYKDRLNSGNLECAPKLIRLYVNAGAHKNVPGLVKRRDWEASLFEESL